MSKELLIGVFNDEDKLVHAFEKVTAKGVMPLEVYTPYPIHEILEGMKHKSYMTHFAFMYGLFGALGILGFLYYTSVVSWPLNFGGKPFNSFPSFIVVSIVATILIVTLLTLLTFSVRAKIFPGKKAEILHEGATDDKFVMVLDKKKLGNDLEPITALLNENGVEEIIEQ